VYSHDVVSRLSLDHVRDIRNTVLWLCNANDTDKGSRGEGYSAVIKRARQWKAGSGSPEDPDWVGFAPSHTCHRTLADQMYFPLLQFIAMRKTLEANMQMANTFPPGRVLWAMRDSDLHPSHRLSAPKSNNGGDRLRLFEVLDVEKVFSQVIFARDMLR
jgi:sn1-specific diacylglycerol lipase